MINMKYLQKIILICILQFTLLLQPIFVVEPITAGLGIATVATAIGGIAYCYVKECCTNRWTNHSANTLEMALNASLFGQHLVNPIVSNSILGHLNDKNPKKALVLSFHGWTGSGKNYVSDIIAEHVFKKGTESTFFHKFISTQHFPYEDKQSVKKYKESVKIKIESGVKKCARSMFVFDEMDKMPKGLSDVMKPFLDFHQNVDGTDYRKSIFIFLSNTGGDKINKQALNHFITGNSRESITSNQMEEILSVSVFNMKGGMQGSELILSGLVDFYIPFLPMEREHVLQCASVAIKRRNKEVRTDVLECVANEIRYFPKEHAIYSKTGCKQVEKKVDACL